MLTRETRDVRYQVAEVRREQAMRRIVRRLSREARKRSAEDAAVASKEGGGRTGDGV
jgi:hypothetical protein